MRLNPTTVPPSIAPISPSLVPNLETARRALAAARSLDEIKAIRDQAEALRAYVQAAGYGLEMQNDVAEIKLRAERKAGELLAQLPKQHGARPSDTGLQSATPSTLNDLGIEKTQAHRWQQVAGVPEPIFEEHVSSVKAERQELTTASVLEKAKELQREQRTAARERRENERGATPVPTVPVRLEVADATNLHLVTNSSVDLILTSPPYGLEKPYTHWTDLADDWYEFMRDWLEEGLRVIKAGGRLALNVPLDTTEPEPRATYAQAVQAAREVGWDYRWTIVWNEGNVSRSVARGSVDSCSAPHVIAPVEMIAVFSQGEWRREGGVSDLDHAEWLEWTNGLWTFPGESRPYGRHPAPFPPELPRRLIKLLSFVGDTVLDPFCGSGTTPLVAHLLGREAIAFDTSEEYIESAKRRIAEAIHASA